MVDVLKTDPLTELSQGKPVSTPTFEEAVMALYHSTRDKVEISSSELRIYNDAGTCIFKKALSDSGTVVTEAEAESGP